MKFLVPNYSCLQNPWLGGFRPQIPVLSVLFPQLNLLNSPQTKFLGTPLSYTPQPLYPHITILLYAFDKRVLACHKAGIESGEMKVLCPSLESTETSVILTEDQPIYRISNPRSWDINKCTFALSPLLLLLFVSRTVCGRGVFVLLRDTDWA